MRNFPYVQAVVDIHSFLEQSITSFESCDSGQIHRYYEQRSDITFVKTSRRDLMKTRSERKTPTGQRPH
jgi:hypothetical protein